MIGIITKDAAIYGAKDITAINNNIIIAIIGIVFKREIIGEINS